MTETIVLMLSPIIIMIVLVMVSERVLHAAATVTRTVWGLLRG